MHPKRCFSSGTQEEVEGKPSFLLSHERYYISQTRAITGEIERYAGIWEEGEKSHVKEEQRSRWTAFDKETYLHSWYAY